MGTRRPSADGQPGGHVGGREGGKTRGRRVAIGDAAIVLDLVGDLLIRLTQIVVHHLAFGNAVALAGVEVANTSLNTSVFTLRPAWSRCCLVTCPSGPRLWVRRPQ